MGNRGARNAGLGQYGGPGAYDPYGGMEYYGGAYDPYAGGYDPCKC